MADILLFPAGRTLTVAAALAATPDVEAWLEDDAGDIGDLDAVASLAAAPSQSLVGLMDKMQVLVARLAPDDGTDAGLCLAEANLLRSVLRDLQAFVMDAIFATKDADLWVPVSPQANLVQENGAGLDAGAGVAHYQV